LNLQDKRPGIDLEIEVTSNAQNTLVLQLAEQSSNKKLIMKQLPPLVERGSDFLRKLVEFKVFAKKIESGIDVIWSL
jgi:hypothetical protein